MILRRTSESATLAKQQYLTGEERYDAMQFGKTIGKVVGRAIFATTLFAAGYCTAQAINVTAPERENERMGYGTAAFLIGAGVVEVARRRTLPAKVFTREDRDAVDQHTMGIDIIVESYNGHRTYFIQKSDGSYARDLELLANQRAARRMAMDEAAKR